MTGVSREWIIELYTSTCAMCRTEFIKGYKGFWCQPACYRLNQVMNSAQLLKRITPSREALVAVYGEDTPAWEGF